METVRQVGNPEKRTVVQPQFTVVETDRDSLYMSLSQAARVWHKHKGTISRHVKDGKLQWHEQTDGEKKLFAPEIAHLYGPPPVEGVAVAEILETAVIQQPVGNASDQNTYQALIRAKDEIIHLLESQLSREREISEQWRREFASIRDHMLALPAPAQPEAEKPRKRLWPFGR